MRIKITNRATGSPYWLRGTTWTFFKDRADKLETPPLPISVSAFGGLARLRAMYLEEDHATEEEKVAGTPGTPGTPGTHSGVGTGNVSRTGERSATEEMQMTTTFISDERIQECEAQGEKARKEGRGRSPSPYFLSAIERKAYQRGWDREQTKIRAM